MGFHAAYNHQQIGHWDDFSQPSQIQLATDKSVHGKILHAAHGYTLRHAFSTGLNPAEIPKSHLKLHQDPLLITQQLKGLVPSAGKGLSRVLFSCFSLFLLLLSPLQF